MRFRAILRIAVLTSCAVIVASVASAQAPAGRQQYESRCARCHGGDGTGGESGPAIVRQIGERADEDLVGFLRTGRPASGMPAFDLAADDMKVLVAYLRTLVPTSRTAPPTIVRKSVQTSDGRTLEGRVIGEGLSDLQLRTDDRHIHLLRKAANGRYRAVTSQRDWTTYHGDVSGNRYTTMTQIDKSNVARLAPRWVFPMPNVAGSVETTPLVVDGVMYVSSANEAWAIDAGNARQLWHFQRQRTKGVAGNAGGGINRGVAVSGDRLFMVTDNAHIISLNRVTGDVLWDTEMADWRQNYNATGAPLPIGNLVVTGTSGGDEGVRGFVAAFDQATGKEVWRFWTVPRAGEPGSETWQGKGIAHPGGSTWMTGAYDPELGTVYWTVGNPGPDLIGDDRLGDNLYTDSVVALDTATGRLKWHFQFTPHDVWDYDAEEPTALVDMTWQGRPRKLLVQANRNGFFYVLDRTTGQFLSGARLVKNVTWATGLDANGRPLRVPGMEPSPDGKRVCPSLDGATNWYSSSFNPLTSLYYVQTNDKCGIFTRTDQEWAAGRGFMGGSFRQAPDEPAQRLLRAIDIRTGKVAWEIPQTGAVNSWGGVLSTAGRVVFFGDDSGALAAADAETGRRLWSFQTSQLWKASPMTYQFDNAQYVAVAAGSTIIAFGMR